ncbi:MAG: hypothetical protein GXO56_00425 [Chloroflexi bacterium]|nr:hypothetical protein [Chloroflexota bacterium]
MKTRTAWQRWLPWALVGLIFVARVVPGPRTIDDAFITFRYARNLLNGYGLVFNPGEHVLGTTTPFYALWMAFLGLFTGGGQAPFPWLALLTNALADALTAWLIMRLARRVGYPLAGYAFAAAWAVAPWSVTFAIGGMETSVYILWLTLTAVAYAEGRFALAFFAGGLSLLTRPDALILLLPLGADYLWRQRKSGWKTWLRDLLPGSALVAAWGLYATAYYGSPVPHSLVAKQQVYHLAPIEATIRLLQHYASPFLLYHWLSPRFLMVGLVLWGFLALVGARALYQREPRLWPWLAFPWLYFAAFAVAHPLIFRWYLTPPLPPYFFSILTGAVVLLQKIPQPVFRRAALGIALFAVPFLSPLGTWQLHPDHGLDRPAPEMAWYKLELLYHRAAAFLEPRLQPDPLVYTVAAADVGVLGYDTRARILDLAGLNSPETLAYFPLPSSAYVINYAVPAEAIRSAQPDYIVILEVYGRETLLQAPWFWQEYTLLADFPTDIYGSRGMLIFGRKP